MNRISSLCLDHVLYIACHTLHVKKNDSDFALGDVGHEVGCHVGDMRWDVMWDKRCDVMWDMRWDVRWA